MMGDKKWGVLGIVECGVEWSGDGDVGCVDQRWLSRWCFRYGMGKKGVFCAVECPITRLACVNVTFICERDFHL